ncbi:MAG: tRNA lysidine(34) synthetase TilS [Mycoplasmoidaceae bacterium]
MVLLQKYIAAVSGGPDSMALLDKYHNKIVGVCHVNYHKRSDSNFDAQIVRDYCKKHKIQISILDVDQKIYKNCKNFQNLARQIRYKFFVKCAKKFKCNNLLIAHNLNDFLETAIMQKNRKSLNFFYGIKSTNKFESLNIYRPLINEFKVDLEKYCQNNGISYAIDSTNALDIYERNRVRKRLSKLSKTEQIKLYKKFVNRNKKQPKLEKQVNLYLNQWSKTQYSVKYFKTVKLDLQNSLIYVYLKNSLIININYNKIKLVRDYIVSKKSNNSLRLADNIRLVKKDGKVKIVRS